MRELLGMYSSSQYANRNAFVKGVMDRGMEFHLCVEEAGLIWDSFDVAAEEWLQPRVAGF
jgi:hypothetical protein